MRSNTPSKPPRLEWGRRIHQRIGLSLCLLLSGVAAATSSLSGQATNGAGAGAQIEPGDRIVLRIPREPELSDTFMVAPSGEAVLPWLGSVMIAEQTAGSLPGFLRTSYAKYLRDPSVDVTVLRRVTMHGEIQEPDVYWVDLTMTLRDLIARAGGITDAGDPSRIEIIRGEERIALGPTAGAQLLATQLRSGDQVVIGRRPWLARNTGTVMGATTAFLSLVITLIQLRR